MQAASTPPDRASPSRSRLSKPQKIGGGLLLSIVGIFLVSVLLPTAPQKLAYALPVAGAGIVLLWVGGIALGIGSRS